jgi:hypothetical protein
MPHPYLYLLPRLRLRKERRHSCRRVEGKSMGKRLRHRSWANLPHPPQECGGSLSPRLRLRKERRHSCRRVEVHGQAPSAPFMGHPSPNSTGNSLDRAARRAHVRPVNGHPKEVSSRVAFASDMRPVADHLQILPAGE